MPSPLPHGETLGIDVGLEKYLATSSGELVKRPKFFNRLHRELQLLQRRLKLKKKGSNKRGKLLQKIARVHERIANTRKDFQFKLAHRLCDQVAPRAGTEFPLGERLRWATAFRRKKNLRERVHTCSSCGYRTDRDVASAQVICSRGLNAVGQTVSEIAP